MNMNDPSKSGYEHPIAINPVGVSDVSDGPDSRPNYSTDNGYPNPYPRQKAYYAPRVVTESSTIPPMIEIPDPGDGDIPDIDARKCPMHTTESKWPQDCSDQSYKKPSTRATL